MSFIQPEHEYRIQERLTNLRHEATVARIENVPTLRTTLAAALRTAAGHLNGLAERLLPQAGAPREQHQS